MRGQPYRTDMVVIDDNGGTALCTLDKLSRSPARDYCVIRFGNRKGNEELFLNR